ncbi:dihydroorotase [Pseudotabrizicola algicola]|uniref:Dihydroorotase family protein n=1 Tax=Pseudotabrizicola algicola TaxID=2709381 RepID=A0A6B3RMC9_9RHOB|nr:dihydroorotase family protein [Pseudotabrizicola algicola]NEX46611.1 dihydroorotase family protein [Pseudotabrizicola algicola]
MTDSVIISGGTVLSPDGPVAGSVLVKHGQIAALLSPGETAEAARQIDASGLMVLPGAIDIHCHIRAPAYPQRGTVASETAACAKGGITTVFEMPITDPCCNAPDRVALRRDHFSQSAHIDFGLYAAPVELTEAAFDALAASGIVALKIFTTPAPVGREHEFAGLAWPHAADQLRVLQLAARIGLPVVVHAEHAGLLAQAESAAALLDPADAATHNAARPPLAEALAVAQLLTMNITAGAKLHIAHVTSADTVEVLRRFAGSSDFSAETCPHYLTYTADDVARAGVCAKINPPIRQAADRAALWDALSDGTIGHVTTDHAAFSAAEKAAHEGNFLTAPPGHPGTEVLLPTLLDAVALGRLTIGQAMRLVSGAAAQRFALPGKGKLAPGADADIVLVDMADETHVTEGGLLTAARSVARLSHGARFRGAVVHTLLAGQTVWNGSLTGAQGLGRFITPHHQETAG